MGNLLRANGRNIMHIFPGDGPFFLNINTGAKEDSSDWAVAEIITWNRRLRRHELRNVEKYLLTKLTSGSEDGAASLDGEKKGDDDDDDDEKKTEEEAEPEYAVGRHVSARRQLQIPRDSAK